MGNLPKQDRGRGIPILNLQLNPPENSTGARDEPVIFEGVCAVYIT